MTAPAWHPRSARALFARQVSLGASMVAVGLASFVAISVASVNAAGGIMTSQLEKLLHNPALAAIYGRAYGVDSPGGVTAWKQGLILALGAALWAVLSATRLTRGGEDDGSFDLLVLGARSRQGVTADVAVVLACASVLAGLAVSAGFVASGVPLAPSLLFGLGLGLVTVVFAMLAIVVSQFLAPRRSASGAAVALVVGAFVVRMIADGTSVLSWLRWFTPFGWLEEMRAFADRRWFVLALPLVASVGLAVVALRLVVGRDVGSGLIHRADSADARLGLVRSPTGFALRQRGTLFATWGASCVVVAAIMGALAKVVVDFAKSDPTYVKMMEKTGFASMLTGRGFIAEIFVFFGMAFAFLAITSWHSEWTDETAGRLEIPLGVGPGRSAWQAGVAAVSVLGVLAVATLCAFATWLGAAVGGSAIPLASAVAGAWNVTVVAAVALGTAVLFHGFAPRWTMAATSTLIVMSFIDATFGPALHWPKYAIDLSVFHHVSLVPAMPMAWTSFAVMLGVALVAGAAGFAGYRRRDLVVG